MLSNLATKLQNHQDENTTIKVYKDVVYMNHQGTLTLSSSNNKDDHDGELTFHLAEAVNFTISCSKIVKCSLNKKTAPTPRIRLVVVKGNNSQQQQQQQPGNDDELVETIFFSHPNRQVLVDLGADILFERSKIRSTAPSRNNPTRNDFLLVDPTTRIGPVASSQKKANLQRMTNKSNKKKYSSVWATTAQDNRNTGDTYYYHKIMTGQTMWEKPPDYDRYSGESSTANVPAEIRGPAEVAEDMFVTYTSEFLTEQEERVMAPPPTALVVPPPPVGYVGNYSHRTTSTTSTTSISTTTNNNLYNRRDMMNPHQAVAVTRQMMKDRGGGAGKGGDDDDDDNDGRLATKGRIAFAAAPDNNEEPSKSTTVPTTTTGTQHDGGDKHKISNAAARAAASTTTDKQQQQPQNTSDENDINKTKELVASTNTAMKSNNNRASTNSNSNNNRSSSEVQKATCNAWMTGIGFACWGFCYSICCQWSHNNLS